MSAPNPAWTHQTTTHLLTSKVNQRLKSISKPLNNNLKLTDLDLQAQAALMGREYDNLCVHNPSSSNEQNLRTFERHGGDSYREMRQNSDNDAIAQQHNLALEIDKKLASKNDRLDHKLANREAINEALLAEKAFEDAQTPTSSETLINEKELRYLMAREEAEFTTEPEAGVSEQSNQEIHPNHDNTGNQRNPTPETTESHSDQRDTQTIIEKFLK
ncbi:MAG TPA: hypothetical protein DCL40_01475, partial [Coxiellaceae bacterium]|nr:hypothetical protein [Coxiellaceae bacterium]